jgi:hypothetical protein
MSRTEFDFDVIGGPTHPPLASLLQRPPQPPAPPAPAALDQPPARPETPAR